jgi:flavin-dependent dehydrogenase
MAQHVGVDVFMGHRVSKIHRDKGTYTITCSKVMGSAKSVVVATGVDYELHQALRLDTPPRFLSGSQVDTTITTEPSRIEIHIGQTFAPGSFGWVIPAGKNASRIGVITLKKGIAWLDMMLKKRLEIPDTKWGTGIKMKPIAYGPVKKSVKGGIITVGEAAGQVKTTTGGGIFYGLLCSEIAVDKLSKYLKGNGNLNDYELTWRSALISELDIGVRMHEIASQLSDQNLEDLFTFVKKNKFWVEMLVPRINFDFHSNLIYFCLKSFGALLRFPVT